MTPSVHPISPAECDALLAPLLPPHGPLRAALAVSGGSDSTALMLLLADWLAATGRPRAGITVLTVDHGLRAPSRAEADAVARQAAVLGLAHAILTWDGPKPATGVQAAARAARYRLIAGHMRAHGLDLLLTAHTADDQAETLLMRLARGSGLDGLAAMAPLAPLDAGHCAPDAGAPLRIARPLLPVPKARLVATLQQRGMAWIEDPSNQSPLFERVRLRAASAALEAAGLTPPMLGLSARRLRRARAALEDATHAFCAPAAGQVAVEARGVIRLGLAALRRAPAEIAVRVLTRAIVAAGGLDAPVPLAGVEAIAEALQSDAPEGAWTLARAKLEIVGECVVIEREPGRGPLPVLRLVEEGWSLWDGRFWVRALPPLAGTVEVRALGAEGLAQLPALRGDAGSAAPFPSNAARQTVPAFWRADTLLAVPCLEAWLDRSLQPVLQAQFKGMAEPFSLPATQAPETP